ncbi:MAG: MBL fold metallo-hydrolase [Gemmatimonadaceae bacterium]|nr:MBL fold metallo-hydrolase [Gemmatimonadaceae bacterium]NUO95543.1 MBL fold metallo-hydrolase [Gemmatimonadaceae bacterium]NUP70713.1 MBL fold metallo-hydrolase [Gemmatimonadaceae bacterium]NUR35272.1 MBL fold metallo-hydrolase [Gemmatimonadaceae bacterium]NUS33200.1 MBL fold metallo-hydrolase [Gemmatimonadaceae bacterium]
MKLTFLGTGTSFGVPQLGCRCAVCRSPDPRDKRNRVGAAIETNAGAILLIDTPPELRLQLIAAEIDRVDAVLYTHGHADHTHGIDDLRAITARRNIHLPMYGAADTLAELARKFAYIFDDEIRPLPGTTKPQGRAIVIGAGESVRIADVDVTAVAVPHGPVTVFAYRIGPLAYVTDAKSLPDDAVAQLRGARVLVLNALFRRPHPSHLSLPEALGAAAAVGAERTYLTHLTHDNFHADLEAELPPGVTPAYDGLTITV